MSDIKCKHCPGFKNCEWRNEEDDTCWYEPDDYPEGDIGSAIVAEIRRQNGE